MQGKYIDKNSDLIYDLNLMLIQEKLRKIKKYPIREYVISEENIEVIRESIISNLKKTFEKITSYKNLLDNESNMIDDYELKQIANDIIYILYTSNTNSYKEFFLKCYIANINNYKLYLEMIVESIMYLGRSTIFPMMKDLFNFEDIFIEDVTFNKDDKDFITIVAIKFKN